MSRGNLATVRDRIVRNSKFLFPVVVIVAVAVTVFIALQAGRAESGDTGESLQEMTPVKLEGDEVLPDGTLSQDIPLMTNEDVGIQTLITTYYETLASGDSVAMAALYDELTDKDRLLCEERAKYIDHISNLEIYTKRGLAEDALLVYVYYRSSFVDHPEEIPGWNTFYVCRDAEGRLYIKNDKNLTEKEKEYGVRVSAQDDTVEFNNRVTAEFNEMMEANPQLSAYLGELGTQLNTAVGTRLAELNNGGTPAAPDGGGGNTPANPAAGTTPAAGGSGYAVATTTVNVRNSDSEQADKLGKVTGGTRVQVTEVRRNGWTKIVYGNSEGFIKSEFLQMEDGAAGQASIGKVTASTNINVRSSASEQGEVLGLLPGGEALELLADENGWCKVRYKGRVGYVKAEYVTR